jgi:DNA-binding response OmpR family regulator
MAPGDDQSKHGGTTMSNPKKTILAIDDDPEICDALNTILTQSGYRVLTATDTTNGYRIFEEHHPDLVILDIMMATMDEGLRFAERIKKKEGIWGVPIMIVSGRPPAEKPYGRTLEEDMEWIKADIFMEKPVDPQDLINNVKKLLKES